MVLYCRSSYVCQKTHEKNKNICENEAKNDGSVSISCYQNQTEHNIKKLRLGSTREMADYYSDHFFVTYE